MFPNSFSEWCSGSSFVCKEILTLRKPMWARRSMILLGLAIFARAPCWDRPTRAKCLSVCVPPESMTSPLCVQMLIVRQNGGQRSELSSRGFLGRKFGSKICRGEEMIAMGSYPYQLAGKLERITMANAFISIITPNKQHGSIREIGKYQPDVRSESQLGRDLLWKIPNMWPHISMDLINCTLELWWL